ARVAIESGSFGPDFRFGADGSAKDTDRIDEAVEMIVRSVEARDEGGRALEAFVTRAERAGPASLVVFVPPRPGSCPPAAGAAEPKPALWRRVLMLPSSREGTPASELEAVIAALSATRAEVIVLDRKSGRRLGDKHRAAMRALEKGRDAKKEAA